MGEVEWSRLGMPCDKGSNRGLRLLQPLHEFPVRRLLA